MRSASVNPFTACFDAEYMPCSGITASDTSLPTVMIAPPCCRSCCTATSEPCTRWERAARQQAGRRRMARAGTRRPSRAGFVHSLAVAPVLAAHRRRSGHAGPRRRGAQPAKSLARRAALRDSEPMPPRPREIPVDRGDRVTVAVDGLGDGPDGLARIGEYVLFVPGVLPGERAEILVTSAARKFGRGELLAVHDPSPERVAPQCAHFLACGGCHRQHQEYGAQLRSKQDRLQRTIAFALGDDAPRVA